MRLRRALTATTAALLTLGFAAGAQAGPRLYSGSIVLQTAGNDTTDGSTEPFTTNIPSVFFRGLHCNTRPFHAKRTLSHPTYYNTNTITNPNGNYNVFTIPNFGGQAATFHTPGSGFIAPGCTGPTLTQGHPIDGSGTVSTTGTYSTSRTASNPRKFTIPASDLARVSSGGSFAYYFPYIFSVHYGDLRNVKGAFSKSGGPGKFGSFTYLNSPAVGSKASIQVTPGSNKFGGTMRLLGTFYSQRGFLGVYDLSVTRRTWLFDLFGAAGLGSQTPATSVDNGFYINAYHGTYNAYPVVAASAFSWTTGTVTVTAVGGPFFGGPFHTVMARKGHDNRTPHGSGEIQMVSPAITRWIFRDGAIAYFTGGIGILKVQVAPEPQEWMLLGAGLSLLGLLYRAKRRSR